jgi:hypothetical protein
LDYGDTVIHKPEGRDTGQVVTEFTKASLDTTKVVSVTGSNKKNDRTVHTPPSLKIPDERSEERSYGDRPVDAPPSLKIPDKRSEERDDRTVHTPPSLEVPDGRSEEREVTGSNRRNDRTVHTPPSLKVPDGRSEERKVTGGMIGRLIHHHH